MNVLHINNCESKLIVLCIQWLFIICFFCNGASASQNTVQKIKQKPSEHCEHHIKITDPQLVAFDTLFQEKSLPITHIYSEFSENRNAKDTLTPIPYNLLKFIDISCDSSRYEEMTIMNDGQKNAALYKFNYSDSISGYLYTMRSQSDNPDFNGIGLVLINIISGKKVGNYPVADLVCDGGLCGQTDSWLTDFNKDGFRDIVSRMIEWDIDTDIKSRETFHYPMTDKITVLVFDPPTQRLIPAAADNVDKSLLIQQNVTTIKRRYTD